MDINQTIISGVFTIIGSVLTYFISLRKISAEIEYKH